MANLRTNNLSGEQGQNAYRGSVVFGGGDNSSAGLTIADNSDLELGSETNWTIEFWLWLNGSVHGDYDVILGKGSATGNNYEYFVEVMSDNTLDFFSTTGGSAWDFQQPITPVLSSDSWYHIAIVRNGTGTNTLKSYVNGQEFGSFTSQNIHTSAYPFGIGYFAGGNNLFSKVTVSNLRIVKGTSVYTAAFTPPFTELKAIPNTVLLCCQDSDNPFKEETGKTITGVGHLANGAVIHPRNNPPYGVDAGNAFGGPIQQSTQGYIYFPTGTTKERVTVSNNYGARGLIMGGITYPGAGYQNVIESIQIASLGNAVDFGDLINKPNAGAGFSSKTRGFVAGGNTPDGNGVNVIQFVTIATLGNATDFGDAGYSRANARGISNNTRGVYSGGESASSPNPSINNIEFITMSTSGNGQDFGDLFDAGSSYATASSPTRGLNLGGYRDAEVNVIDMITIATTGNSIDFGDLINTARNGNGGVSNGHRGIVMGGYSSPARTNVIQYVTIQSMGNAIDFGDLTDARDPGVTSSLTRGIATSGDYPANTNIIDFIEIMTTANAVDFGDMLTKTSSPQTCSNAHGGLADDM